MAPPGADALLSALPILHTTDRVTCLGAARTGCDRHGQSILDGRSPQQTGKESGDRGIAAARGARDLHFKARTVQLPANP